ncbi:TPA: hypothetical protein ACSCX2_004071 [Aeromonas veronii]|uniref:hypothetical protein n=1 Tax=Aeromonas veronii TaxID=654 RepID=UPI003D21CB6F
MLTVLSKLGIDKTVLFVLLSKGAGSISGVITLLLIGHFLTPIEQGYYYTFASILSLQIVFELGFGSVLIQFVSHEMVGVKISHDNVTGNKENLSRLYYIISLAIKWYFAVSTIVLIVISPLGYLFFTTSTIEALPTSTWLLPWLFLVFSASLSLMITPVLSIAEGCGFVTDIARMRLSQALCAAFLSWLALLSGYGLYATAATSAAIFIVGARWIKKYFYHVITAALKCPSKEKYSHIWKDEIFPMQWRIALSWLSGYFIFQLFNPVAFRFFGATFAGQLGLSLSIVTLMTGVSLSWFMTKVPTFGRLIADNKRVELDLLYKKTFKDSLLFLCFGAMVAIISLFILDFNGYAFAQRFIEPSAFVLLVLTGIGNHIIACQATYVRSHKVEKYLGNAIMTALLMVALLFISTYFSENYIVYFYFMTVWLFFLPHATYIYRKFKQHYREK